MLYHVSTRSQPTEYPFTKITCWSPNFISSYL